MRAGSDFQLIEVLFKDGAKTEVVFCSKVICTI